MAADEDNVQASSKVMESTEDKKSDEIVPLTLESILCYTLKSISLYCIQFVTCCVQILCNFLSYFLYLELLD